jgi:hypothetical protein
MWSILTEIYLWHACTCRIIVESPGQGCPEMGGLRDACYSWIAPDKVARCRQLFALPPAEDLGGAGPHKFGAAGVPVQRVYDEVAKLNALACTAAADHWRAVAGGAGAAREPSAGHHLEKGAGAPAAPVPGPSGGDTAATCPKRPASSSAAAAAADDDDDEPTAKRPATTATATATVSAAVMGSSSCVDLTATPDEEEPA